MVDGAGGEFGNDVGEDLFVDVARGEVGEEPGSPPTASGAVAAMIADTSSI